MSFRTLDRRGRRIRRCALWAGFVLLATAVLAGLIVGEAPWQVLAAAAFASVAGLVAADRWMRDEGGAPVLCYHSISDQGWVPWPTCIVSLETFERHLQVLARGGFTVMRTKDLVAARLARQPLPPRPVAINFDDGYLDNWTAALPGLRRHGLPATMFVSLDFIDDGDRARPTLDDVAEGCAAAGELQWTGYVNWSEIAAMEQGGVIDVLPHGVDHAMVEIGPRVVDHLTARNWRRLAWVQWRAMPGSKADWYRNTTPPVVPLGTPVRENAPALSARAWHPEHGRESEAAYRDRVRGQLGRARRELQARLDRPIDIFCWPNNGTCDAARAIAEEVGYRATTGGVGENRAEEDPRVLSRLGVGDRIAGWRWPAAEAVGLYAAIRVFQGNYYWFYPLIVFAGLRGLHRLLAAHAADAPAGLSSTGVPGSGTGGTEKCALR